MTDYRNQKSVSSSDSSRQVGTRRGEPRREVRSQKSIRVMFTVCCLLFTIHFSLFAGFVYAQDDLIKSLKKKQHELTEKEEALKKEEERLKVIRKEVDEKIDKYTKLLTRIEETLKKIEVARAEKIEHLVKTYEAMPAEEAAERLAALDESTAVKIILRMKSKKASAVLALMEPKKVADITVRMARFEKKFPTK